MLKPPLLSHYSGKGVAVPGKGQSGGHPGEYCPAFYLTGKCLLYVKPLQCMFLFCNLCCMYIIACNKILNSQTQCQLTRNLHVCRLLFLDFGSGCCFLPLTAHRGQANTTTQSDVSHSSHSFLFFLFFETGSQYIALKLLILLPQPLQYKNCRHVLLSSSH